MSTLLRHRLNMLRLRAKARFPSEDTAVKQQRVDFVTLFNEPDQEKRAAALARYTKNLVVEPK